MTDDLRYPVGKFHFDPNVTPATRRACFAQVREAPAAMRAAVRGLTASQFDTPYRPDGWTVRQVVHHVPDSHMNAYVRMKLAVTEDHPAVKTYEEGRWADLPEAKSGAVAMSIDLLDALHRRWVAFLRALPEGNFRKTFSHPEWGIVSIDESLGMYAWHCRHHTEHIRMAIKK